mmetsp:Transcript_16036/g.35244  ORF Transcript_16036/g.35244 Transcript_16036/m.35244 type:complete len:84 (-) Transcript_16036:1461-1712(-)
MILLETTVGGIGMYLWTGAMIAVCTPMLKAYMHVMHVVCVVEAGVLAVMVTTANSCQETTPPPTQQNQPLLQIIQMIPPVWIK